VFLALNPRLSVSAVSTKALLPASHLIEILFRYGKGMSGAQSARGYHEPEQHSPPSIPVKVRIQQFPTILCLAMK